MAFRSPEQDNREFEQMKAARARVMWIADRIFLSVYHKRPKAEIAELMKELDVATRVYGKRKVTQ